MKIGFYDSGLGGIKVLKDALDAGLAGEIYFLADLKNNPYGLKSQEEIRSFANENVGYLISLGCGVVVVACNTATAVAITDLRNNYNIPIIGTEPAVKVAVDASVDKKILVLATTLTCNGEKLNQLITKYDLKDKADLVPADKIVKFVEDINFNAIQDEVNDYIANLLAPYDLNNYSHIILGCTHFPIIKNNFIKYINEKYGNINVAVIDGAAGVINNLFSKIDNIPSDVRINIITTEFSEAFEKRVYEILGDKYNISFSSKE